MLETYFAYSSELNNNYDESEIDSIAKQSIENNQANNITGILVFDGKKIYQYIEGGTQAIADLVNKIKHDPRHFNFTPCLEGQLPKRSFEAWNMALIKVDDHSYIDALEEMAIDVLPTHLKLANFKP